MSEPCLHCIRTILTKRTKLMAPPLLTFATEEDAGNFGLYTWKQLENVLPETCASKKSPCNNTYTCAVCKYNKDEEQYSPLGDQAQGTTHLDHMLNALLDAHRKHRWVTNNTFDTLQALSDLFAEQGISAQVRDGLSNWGEAAVRKSHWRLICTAPASYHIHQAPVKVEGVKQLYYTVTTDVGNGVYGTLIREVWRINLDAWAAGKATNDQTLGDVLETLFSIHYLAPFYPDTVDQFPGQLFGQILQLMDDCIKYGTGEPLSGIGPMEVATSPDYGDPSEHQGETEEEKPPIPRRKGKGASEQTEHTAADASRPGHWSKAKAATPPGTLATKVSWAGGTAPQGSHQGEGDTMENYQLQGIKQTLCIWHEHTMAQAKLIRSLIDQIPSGNTTHDYAPQCLRDITHSPREAEDRTAEEEYHRKDDAPAAMLTDNKWGPKYFPVLEWNPSGAPCLNSEVIRDLEDFEIWASKQDALLESEATVTHEEWKSLKTSIIGDVRFFGKNTNWSAAKEFWLPIGIIDFIATKRTNTWPMRLDREMVLDWLLTTRLLRNNALQDEMSFQVLKIKLKGRDHFFWRANDDGDTYKKLSTQEYQEQRATRRANWAQSDSSTTGATWRSNPYGSQSKNWTHWGADS